MKTIYTSVIFLLFFYVCIAQKPSLKHLPQIDFPTILSSKISNNGRHILYVVSTKNSGLTLVIRSTESNFKRDFSGQSSYLNATFSEDSRFVIFTNAGDSLCVLEIDSNRMWYIANCISFKIPESNSDHLVYHLKDKKLIVYNFKSGAEKIYPNVKDYSISDSGRILLIKTQYTKDSSSVNNLIWADLIHDRTIEIWHGTSVSNLTLNDKESKLVFLAKENHRPSCDDYELWYFDKTLSTARPLIEKKSYNLKEGWKIANRYLQFSPNNDKIFLYVRPTSSLHKIGQKLPNVDIWNYKDRYLQTEQLADLETSTNRAYRAVLSISTNEVVQLENENDRRSRSQLNSGGNDNYLITQTAINFWETSRISNDSPITYLVSTKDGTRKCISKNVLNSEHRFSPGGKYVIWYDPKKRAFMTYNLLTDEVINITHNIPTKIYDELWDIGAPPRSYGLAMWSENDQYVYIYDRYDIWKVDPSSEEEPSNITNGYGRRTKTIFRYVYLSGKSIENGAGVPIDSTIILSAFDETNKANGFYMKELNVTGNPILLVMAPEIFYFPENFSFVTFPQFLLKAKYTNTYLLKRESATEYPNLHITKNFMDFKKISDLKPQSHFNWFTSELLQWKTFEGKQGTGILYKPENFDPENKYPIIVYCYERMSDGLNKFMEPGLSDGPINIPYFVSQGYLIFCPDVKYTVGNPGQSAFDYIVSGTKYLSKYSWVDPKRIGIQGHSFGGYEVNYIITRTNLFKAAASAAGLTNFVSDCGTLKSGLHDAHDYVSYAQSRLGASLWKSQLAYIRNSPIFGADSITTPLLILHNKRDEAVAWSQSIEFFTALRYLGKKVWMLQYDNGGHTLNDETDQLDYTTRLNQYFDYYLKDAKAPVWMTVGLPASEKMITSGLLLDEDGAP